MWQDDRNSTDVWPGRWWVVGFVLACAAYFLIELGWRQWWERRLRAEAMLETAHQGRAEAQGERLGRMARVDGAVSRAAAEAVLGPLRKPRPEEFTRLRAGLFRSEREELVSDGCPKCSFMWLFEGGRLVVFAPAMFLPRHYPGPDPWLDPARRLSRSLTPIGLIAFAAGAIGATRAGRLRPRRVWANVMVCGAAACLLGWGLGVWLRPGHANVAKIGLGVGMVLAAGAMVTRLTRPGSPPYPQCKACGYNLTGNVSGTCPECGTPSSGAGTRRADAGDAGMLM